VELFAVYTQPVSNPQISHHGAGEERGRGNQIERTTIDACLHTFSLFRYTSST
jgi:hypothetical protein